MIAFLKFLVLLCFINHANAKNNWLGEWIATDNWQSEFLIKINEDGSATSNYGSGESGEWKSLDGNLKIFWNSGKTDYFFNGVMGYQRIRKNKNQSYTSGLRKLSD
tara:strand:- start:72 stop:389 length:318 start_codon:yes stop_codon:yes gene_type:complete